jgi:hypothetical protein
MGPNELVDRLRSASAHVETDASGLAKSVPADFIKLLTVAVDSRLAPLYRHVLYKQTQDSHEIFALTGPAISQLDKYFAYMLSVHDDGGERGPHLPDVFAAFSPDLKANVLEKVKPFRVDATFVADFKKGDWIKAGKRESIIVRLFDLFGSWLVHFNKIRPTAATTVYGVLVHAHFDNFRLIAGRHSTRLPIPACASRRPRESNMFSQLRRLEPASDLRLCPCDSRRRTSSATCSNTHPKSSSVT